MANATRGVVAAGHPLTAEAGAEALRSGGNAVDAAIAAMLTSFVAEPLLTSLGAGGYMLVVPPGAKPLLLDFFVEAPGRGARGLRTATLVPADVSFGDATQRFHIGPASVGAWGTPAGVCAASRRFGRLALAQLVEPAAALARDGVTLAAMQAYVAEILEPIIVSTPEIAALWAPEGKRLVEGDCLRQPELADTLELLGREGAEPFYAGDVGQAAVELLEQRGGLVTAFDLASYEVIPRAPVRVGYRGRVVLSNPPPSAGGALIALALIMLARIPGSPAPPSVLDLVGVMEAAQQARTPGFLEGLASPGFLRRFLSQIPTVPTIGSTTHISVLDGDGWACSVTTSNGEGSGIVIPGTGIHLNNMLGEEDLNPLGFLRHPPGRRLPSMMAPTIMMGADGLPELVLGSAGSNRIRSAILQTIVGVADHGLAAQPAVDAPRIHAESGTVYAEPGIDLAALEGSGRRVAPFRNRNLFFGGVNAVERNAETGEFSGGGDPRRGGAVAVA